VNPPPGVMIKPEASNAEKRNVRSLVAGHHKRAVFFVLMTCPCNPETMLFLYPKFTLSFLITSDYSTDINVCDESFQVRGESGFLMSIHDTPF
jgi:hypothetical protein